MAVIAPQKKRHSFMEVCLSTLIGLVVAYTANMIIIPIMLGVRLDHSTNVALTLFFTVVSIVRSYYVRRLFNWLHVKELL